MKLFVEKLPSKGKTALLDTTSLFLGESLGDVSQDTIKESELYKLVHEAINRFARVTAYLKQPEIQKPVPRPVKEVSDLLDEFWILHVTHLHSVRLSRPLQSKSFLIT